jgi:O-antigen ligase
VNTWNPPLAPPSGTTAPRSVAPARGARPPRIWKSVWIIAGFAAVLIPLASISTMLAAPIFVIGFLVIAWCSPVTALMIAAAAAVFPNDVGGGPVRMALGEIGVTLAFPVVLARRISAGQKLRAGPVLLPAAIYLLVCVLSSAMHWRGVVAVTSLFQMVVYLVITPLVFANISEDDDSLLPIFYAYLASACALGLAVVVTRSAYLFGIHKNNIGATLATALVICTELWLFRKGRRPRLLTIALVILSVGLVLSASRGAWASAVAAVLLILLMRGQLKLAFRLAMFLLPLVIAGWWLMPEDRREYLTDTTGDSVVMRQKSIDFAYAQFKQDPVFGAGLGLRKEYDATNVILALLAETGILGMLTFLGMHVVFGRAVWRARGRVAPDSRSFSLLTIGLALVLAKSLHGFVDHYWSRGSLTMVWAGAGLASAVCVASRTRRSGRANA